MSDAESLTEEHPEVCGGVGVEGNADPQTGGV